MGIHAFSDDGVGVATADMMKAAMQKCRDVDGIIAAHTEDMSYRKPNACMHEASAVNSLVLPGFPVPVNMHSSNGIWHLSGKPAAAIMYAI